MSTPPLFKDDVDFYLRTLQTSIRTSERVDACHFLGRVTGREAIDGLIIALEDRAFPVRWAAAEALLCHGHDALIPLLRALATQHSQHLYDGAHHVLGRMPGPKTRHTIQPVLDALEGIGATASVPVAANKALNDLMS